MPGNFHAIPESVLQTWPKPNYVDPVARRWFPAFGYALMGASTVLVLTRFYLRAKKQAGNFGLDDALIFVAWVFAIGFTTVGVLDTERYGIGTHTWDVPPKHYVGAALMGWLAQVMFLVSTCATKVSVLLFYRRMVKDTYSRKWLYAVWTAITFTGALLVGVLITYCFICQPLSAYWESYNLNYNKEFTCIDGNVLSPFLGALSVSSDLYTVLLPCLMLRHYKLDLNRRQRIGLNVIFSLGLIVAGCGLARTYYLWKINHMFDTSWVGFDLLIWSTLECQLAIMIACAPALRALFRRYLSTPLSRMMSSNTSYLRGGEKGTNGSYSYVPSTMQSSVMMLPEKHHDRQGTSVAGQRAVGATSPDSMDDWSQTRSSSPWPLKPEPSVQHMPSVVLHEARSLDRFHRHAKSPTLEIVNDYGKQWRRDDDVERKVGLRLLNNLKRSDQKN